MEIYKSKCSANINSNWDLKNYNNVAYKPLCDAIKIVKFVKES